MTFGNFGDPVDPAYVEFKNGLVNAIADTADRWRLRWSPKRGDWFRYDAAVWALDDLGLSDTPPGGALRQRHSWPKVEYEVGSTYELRSLWDRLAKATALYKARYPTLELVWSPWNAGDWRYAFKRASPSPPPPPAPPPPSGLPKRAQDQIAQVNQWLAMGTITADQAKKMIEDIIRANLPDA